MLSDASEQAFLPFPTEKPKVSRRTALIFDRLAKSGELSPKTVGLCAPLMQDIQNALKAY